MKKRPKVLTTGWIRMERHTGFYPFVLFKTKHEAQESFCGFYRPDNYRAVRVELRTKP